MSERTMNTFTTLSAKQRDGVKLNRKDRRAFEKVKRQLGVLTVKG